ncbi:MULTISPECIES: type II toxin-antitoxin system HicB family antitoxin [Pseudomonas]|jgi:predicted HicB family RNase H-like nuclease|uniref:type II toxin-antitoxin system HicB family antitoxin n=1 Tax=Pseudomonas TaxID=286 RepID=UPI0009091D6D|nr:MULTISPECIES: type II toxin-antitoxin system HicB family antitoxin [Pseudomonas]TCV68974.1 putative HicB family RNase H-like nuclease [Pseudomonas fluorescens]SFW69528.1 Predicted nuclease of the RNAse H fold, HicB family [Pseudomonas sp. NFACC04-2]
MNVMNYQGYAARIEYSEEDGLFVGHIAGIKDVVGFHGESVQELRAAFEDAVVDYLDTCAKLGRPPQKPYSGKLSLRLAPALHATVAVKAELAHKSINQWVSDVLDREVHA